MLAYVALPTSEISGMKAAHLKMMSVLLSFSDRGGKCWPSIRTLAARAAETVGWVQRNLREMASLKDADDKPRYFERRRRFGSYVYKICARFLPRVTRQRVSSDSGAQPKSFHRNSQAYAQGGDSPASPKENQEAESFSHEKGSRGRCAPSEADKAAVAQVVEDLRHQLRSGGPRFIRDEAAYEAARKAGRFVNLVRGLMAWVGGRYTAGPERWELEAALNEAVAAGDRKQTPRAALAVVNRLAEERERYAIA
jgi:hypothetical protein